MTYALLSFCENKVTKQHILEAISRRQKIRVVGVYSKHMTNFAARQGYTLREEWVGAKIARKRIKRYNFKRPLLYRAIAHDNSKNEDCFMLCVCPGKDYVTHYGRNTSEKREM
jgi:hypothetical protein